MVREPAQAAISGHLTSFSLETKNVTVMPPRDMHDMRLAPVRKSNICFNLRVFPLESDLIPPKRLRKNRGINMFEFVHYMYRTF